MGLIFRAVILCVAGAIMAALFRKNEPEFAIPLTLLTVVLVFETLSSGFFTFFATIREIAAAGGISESMLAPLFKIMAISLVVKAGGSLCRDVGEQALEVTLETAGSLCAFLAMLPLIRSVLDMLMELLL